MKERELDIEIICGKYKAEELDVHQASFRLLNLLPLGSWDTWHYRLLIRVLEVMREGEKKEE